MTYHLRNICRHIYYHLIASNVYIYVYMYKYTILFFIYLAISFTGERERDDLSDRGCINLDLFEEALFSSPVSMIFRCFSSFAFMKS